MSEVLSKDAPKSSHTELTNSVEQHMVKIVSEEKSEKVKDAKERHEKEAIEQI